jgi:hypothetical protein
MVFLMSGLAHELVLAYIMAPKFVWGASTFFFVQVNGRKVACAISIRVDYRCAG